MSANRILPSLPGPSAGLRIGLLGGSFNPAHEGHLHVAETALQRLQLDWVWWIVARGNPLKSSTGAFGTRLASAREFTTRHPRLRVTDIEQVAGLTYSIDTLTLLARRAPRAHFVWLMGGDNLGSFHLWKDWQSIARTMPIAVVGRPGAGPSARTSPFARTYAAARILESKAARLPEMTAPAWVYLKAPFNSLSSTALRAARS